MNKPSPINQTTLRILYYRNKQLITPVIIFAVSLVIILEAIIPQIQQWFAIRVHESDLIQKINQLNQNINTISKVDENSLDKEISFLSQVLPQSKDYIGVLNAISQTAILSGASLGDYSFDVGDLSKTEVKGNIIQIKLAIKGGVTEAEKFIKQLKSQAPLSNVASVEIENNTVSIVSVFYFKPFPKVVVNENSQLQSLSTKDDKQYQDLQKTIQTNGSQLSSNSF